MQPVRTLRVVVAGALTVGIVGGGSGTPEPQPTPTPTVEPTVTASPEPEPEPTPDPWISMIATAGSDSIEVFAAPGDTEPHRTVTAAEAVSLPERIPMTFLVDEQREGWVEVYLPVRPNGSSGWVRAEDVTLATTDFRVEVRLDEHRLLLYRADEVVLDVPVGVGREEVPTPGGIYYIKELLQPPEPGGVYGAYAYGLSGFSPVLESFAGGQGVIGIHGTNEPELVGTDVSHGCIRLVDADITRMVEEFGLPLGTPVEILA